MQGGEKKRGGICPSVEALDCKSGIFQVADFNLEEKQRGEKKRREERKEERKEERRVL